MRKARTLTTSLAIAFGVAFVAGSIIISSTMNRTFDDLFSSIYKDVDASISGPIEVKTEDGFEFREQLDAKALETVAAVPSVLTAEPYVGGTLKIIGKDGKPLQTGGAPQFGDFWIPNSKMAFWNISEGRAPTAPNEILIDRGTFKRSKFKIGKNVQLVTKNGPKEFLLVGVVRAGSVDSLAGAKFVLFNSLEVAQAEVGRQGKVESISAHAKDGVSQKQLVSDIQQAFRAAGSTYASYEVITGKEATKRNQDMMKEMLKFISYFLYVFAGISLVVGGFLINNTFTILLAQRMRESALLRAIGARRRQLMAATLIEAIIVGLVASIVGFLLGIVFAKGIGALFRLIGSEMPDNGLVIPISAFVVSLLIGVTITVIASLIPSFKASRVPPLAALRDMNYDNVHRSKSRFAAATVLTAIGIALIVIGFAVDMDKPFIAVGAGVLFTFLGVAGYGPFVAVPFGQIVGWPIARMTTGRFARENVIRNPRRTASTAAALLIGVAFVTFAATFAQSAKATFSATIDSQFSGDFVVLNRSEMFSMDTQGMPMAVADKIATLPEVGSLVRGQLVFAEVDGKGVMYSAVSSKPVGREASSFGKLIDLDVQKGSIESLGADGVALGEKYAKSKQLELGKKFDVQFANGPSKTLEVKAIFKNDQLLGSRVLSLDAIAANGLERIDNNIVVKKASKTDTKSAIAAVKRVTDAYPTVQVQDNSEYKASLMKQLDQMLYFIYALLALTIIIALFGITNTLALSVFERTREIGLLRAVGMSRRQTRTVIRLEAIIISLLGALQGIIVGVLFAWALVLSLKSEGFTHFALPWGQFLAILIVAIIAGLIAAALPARRAARLNMLKAISFE